MSRVVTAVQLYQRKAKAVRHRLCIVSGRGHVPAILYCFKWVAGKIWSLSLCLSTSGIRDGKGEMEV